MRVQFSGVNNEERFGEVIMTKKALKQLADKLMTVNEFAFDTETNTLRVQSKGEMKLVGISISFGEQHNYYIPTGHTFDTGQLEESEVVKYLKPVFERKDVRIIGQNLKFDMHVLANVDIYIQTEDIFDTMVASWITDENREKGLKALTNYVYGTNQTKFDECINTVTAEEKKSVGLKPATKAPFYLVRIDVGAPYAIADAYWTWRHYCDWMLDEITSEGMDTIFFKVQMPFLRTLYNMERRGVMLDVEKLKRMSVQASEYLEELEYQIIEIFGIPFKITSSQQLQEVLFGYCKVNKKGEPAGNMELIKNAYNFPIQSTTKSGAPSTGGSELTELTRLTYKKDKRKKEGQKLVKLVLKYKKLAKLQSAFINGLLDLVYPSGKVHPSFNQLGTDSGRLSCSEPNLQQLPRPIEMDDYLELDEWIKENEVEVSKKDLKQVKEELEHLVYDLDYPTGEIKLEKMHKVTKEYVAYLEEWRAYNDDNVFWKFFEIRGAFIPDNTEDECIIALDYSNLEMRLLAHFSQDPFLMDTFIHDHDAHGATAVNMFNLDCTPDEAKKKYKPLRQIAKVINFLLMYGGGAFTLFNTLSEQQAKDEDGNPITKEKAQEYYDAYFEAYAGVAEFIQNQKRYAHKHEQVFTLIGRKRRLPEINSRDMKISSYNERLSVNSAIQGSGGDIMMMCQPKIDNDKRLQEMNCKMILQVHDELVFTCPKEHVHEAIPIIKHYMENALPKPLNIPLRVDADYGASYASAK